MELWKTVDGEEKLVEQVYDNSSGSSSGSNSKAFDTTRFSNGDYILKMTLKDEAGNEKVISKKITIANRIEKPILEAAPSKDGNVKINWQMPDAVKVINGLQYKVEDQEDSTWIKIEGSDTLSGSFIAAVPNQEGSYKVSVRAIDSHGVTGNERTITVRVDKTAPKAEITSVLQGLVKGSVSDTEFLEWKVYVKAKDDADDTYELKLEGTDQKENGLFGSIALYDEKYPAATWYTVKLTATDKAGNQTTVTKDVYKDESSPVPEIVEPDFRIQRPEYQSYTVPQFVLPDTAESLSLTASWPRTFTLGSADWYVNNKKTDTDTATHNLKKSDGSGKYDADTPYMIAAVARGFLGGARYSTTLLKNAQVKDILFKEKTEETISFEEAVGFTLIGGSSDCAYYAKLEGGEYKEITPGETIEISDLNSNQLTADKLTIKADATEGADADAVLLSLDQLEKESFEISGIESYRPDLLSASDKVNYKTYLKWGIPENLPEDISYEVYRSTEAGFDPALSELLTEVRTGYYVEPNVDYATKFYYRVRAVKKDAEGKIVARSSFSDEAASTVVDADEFTKRLGYKEYWDYADFDLPMGSGYIEKSEGNFVYEQTDEELANEHLEVDLTRTYNSMASSKSAFGVGWNHKYDIDLLTTDYSDKLEEGEQLVMKDSSGTLFFFTREPNSAGEYISSMGRYLKLRKLEGTEKNFNVELPDRTAGTESGKITVPVEAAYTVETKENITYWFNQGGQLVYVDEPNGNYLLFEHDINSGLMAKITTSKNLSMTFTYNTQPGTDPTTVKQVTMPDGSSMSYNYASGRLTSAIKTGSAGQGSITYTYGYDGNGKLNSIKDGAGNAYNLTCDNKGRVAKAEYPDGQSINLQRQRSEGQMPKTVTTVTKDGFTMSSETASFDTSSGNCLETVDDDDLITTYVYRDEMLAKTTSQVAYETVENGVMSQKTDTRVTTTEYDNTQNVTREEGGFEQWTELVEYDYDFDGEYDTDFPSHEAEWMDDELVSDVYYDYDEFGNIIREFDEVSDILTEYDYYLDGEEEVDSDFYGEIESETESLNGVVQSTTQYSYHYDTSGNKTETITETVGETTTVTVSKYDVMGRELESTTSVNGQTKSQNVNTFDAFGRVTRSVTTEGSLTTTTVNVYNGNGSVASETTTTSDGNKTESQTVTYEYDNMNRVISQTTTADGKSRPETTTYAYGSIEKNPVLGDTESVYAKITTTISGSVVSKTFTDPKGNVIREDTGGVKTYYAYDASGNQIASATVGDGEAEGEALITANAFDQNGNNTCTMADVVYDSETKTFTAAQDAIITSSVYDGQSRVTRSIDGKGSATTYGYDEQGRMTSITQDADGSPATTKMDYVDPVSGDNTSKTTITLANGSKSRTIVNVEGQTVQESDLGAGSETPINKDYVFTNSGNVLRLTDSAGNYREYEYDPADRQTAVNYFDKNGIQTLRTEFSYDVLGNVTEMRDYRYENGVKTLYRFTERRYDGFGSMTSEAEVDCDGNEPAETELSAMRIAYTYDDDGKLVSTRYPSGFDSNVSGLEYDYGDYSRLMKIKAVTTGGASDLREYAYDAKGNVSSIKDDRTALGGEGHVLKVYGYDHFLRPASITVTDSERDGVAEEYTYAYDKNGQIVTETKLNDYPSSNGEKVDETWAYTFDALGRLTNTTVTDDTSGSVKTQRAYTYDKAGNRLSETENGRTTTNTYNGLNQMLTSGTRSYTYDANGNLIKETGSNGLAKTYSYDADNRLDMAVLAENGTTTLNQKNTYNGEGQRVSKTENDVTTRYSYQGGSVVHTDGSESVKAMNILGESGNIVASERNKEGAKAYYFYNKDMRSSTTSILSGDGNCEAAYQYSDFGETTVNSEFYNEIAYTGGIWDKGTGLYYLNARYYNPDDGRFLTEDTDRGNAENPGTLHLYAYCANNPVNYVDPSGHVFETILDLASVGWSFYEYVKNPSWNNFGWLMWDIGATAVPFVPGSYVKKGTRLAGKVSKSKRAAVPLTQSISSIGRGQHLAIGTYKALSRACRGAANRSSYELHHIIEKRFHYIFRSKTNTWPTALLVKPVHNTITRRYRQAYKYFIGTKKAKEAYYRKVTKTKMIGIVQQVYVDMPSLLLIAVQQVKNDYSNRP